MQRILYLIVERKIPLILEDVLFLLDSLADHIVVSEKKQLSDDQLALAHHLFFSEKIQAIKKDFNGDIFALLKCVVEHLIEKELITISEIRLIMEEGVTILDDQVLGQIYDLFKKNMIKVNDAAEYGSLARALLGEASIPENMCQKSILVNYFFEECCKGANTCLRSVLSNFLKEQAISIINFRSRHKMQPVVRNELLVRWDVEFCRSGISLDAVDEQIDMNDSLTNDFKISESQALILLKILVWCFTKNPSEQLPVPKLRAAIYLLCDVLNRQLFEQTKGFPVDYQDIPSYMRLRDQVLLYRKRLAENELTAVSDCLTDGGNVRAVHKDLVGYSIKEMDYFLLKLSATRGSTRQAPIELD